MARVVETRSRKGNTTTTKYTTISNGGRRTAGKADPVASRARAGAGARAAAKGLRSSNKTTTYNLSSKGKGVKSMRHMSTSVSGG